MNFYARTQSYRCIITEKTSQVNHFFHVFPGKNLSTGHLTESCLYFRRKLCYHTHRRRVSRETHTPQGDNHLLCKKFQSNSPGRSPIPARGRKCRKRTPVRCAFFVCQIVSVGATLGRPWILLRKIHRRQAKTGFFSCGKSEKHRFSAGDHGSPLRYSQK